MPRLSEVKFKKICEHALEFLYSNYPQAFFTAHLAREMARDEEFMKKALETLYAKRLVNSIKTSPTGEDYVLRVKWVLSPEAKEKYDELAKGF